MEINIIIYSYSCVIIVSWISWAIHLRKSSQLQKLWDSNSCQYMLDLEEVGYVNNILKTELSLEKRKVKRNFILSLFFTVNGIVLFILNHSGIINRC